MRDFLAHMAASSAARMAAARARESESALLARALASPAPLPLPLAASGFDLIAEVKRCAPSAGRLARPDDEGPAGAVKRAATYARAGAAAVSILTEPGTFAGSLDDLTTAARVIPVPMLRKDFLVEPYQVLEARAARASGVLVIVRILDDERLSEMLDAAARIELFVLLEAFDEKDLIRAGKALDRVRSSSQVLVGLNTRDLETLAVDPAKLRRLRPALPPGAIAVAESGIATDDDAREVARLGYRLALVGSALMRARDPGDLAARLLAAGREEVLRCGSA